MLNSICIVCNDIFVELEADTCCNIRLCHLVPIKERCLDMCWQLINSNNFTIVFEHTVFYEFILHILTFLSEK